MKFFCMDTAGEGVGVDIALRAQEAGHEVRYWLPVKGQEQPAFGKGLLERPKEWEPSMDWADLILLTENTGLAEGLAPYFGKGYPILGTNQKAAQLELDRGVGQKVLADHDIETLPFQVVSSVDEAIDLVVETEKAYVFKPWGGDGDKAMTYVADTPDDAIFTLEKWERDGLFKGQLMLQEKVSGIEMGISGWFGPGGWNAALEESFEHKKFMNDDLGCNTGEQGTVIRHVHKSKLFEQVLEPLTDYLHSVRYVGDCSVNCIIDEEGKPWPLEFTMRLGWPDFCIRQVLVAGDPVEWMLDLLYGRDTFKVSSDIAVGVVMTHGDYPQCEKPSKTAAGYPLVGVDEHNYASLSFQQVMEGPAAMLIDGKVAHPKRMLTAGTYVAVASGVGATVREAQRAAYRVADKVRWPSNVMYRTDVGDRLRKELPRLQENGFAEGMSYD